MRESVKDLRGFTVTSLKGRQPEARRRRVGQRSKSSGAYKLGSTCGHPIYFTWQVSFLKTTFRQCYIHYQLPVVAGEFVEYIVGLEVNEFKSTNAFWSICGY